MLNKINITNQPTDCPVCFSKSYYKYSKNDYKIYQCSACRLGFIHPGPNKKKLHDVYNRKEESINTYYHTDYSQLEYGLKKMYSNTIKYIMKRYPQNSFENVLDIGCANGYFLDSIKIVSKNSLLTGIDISEDAAVIEKKGYTYYQGFIEEVDLPEEHYDFVFMGDAFEHFYDPRIVVQKLQTIMKQKGVVVITTIDFESLIAKLTGRKWRLLCPPVHLFFWTKRSLLMLFEEFGFKSSFRNFLLYYPREHLYRIFKMQFGFNPVFIKYFPKTLPVYSMDLIMGVFYKE